MNNKAVLPDLRIIHDCITWTRRAQFKSFFGVVHKEFEIASFDLISFLEGNNQVAVVCRMKAKICSTGKPIDGLEVHLWTFDRTGKVVRFRHFVDTHQHFHASR